MTQPQIKCKIQKDTWLDLTLPTTGYETARQLQLDIVHAKADGKLDADVVIWLSHSPVFTLGRRGGLENLLKSPDALACRGITVAQAERGGNITYHGPGQLVCYPILDLDGLGMGVPDLVRNLEQVMIDTAADVGVRAGRNQRNSGVWVGNAKLGSIGLAVRHGISFHGLALNINPDLTPFGWINPCGMAGLSVTSLQQSLGEPIDSARVQNRARHHMARLFNRKPMTVSWKRLREIVTHGIPEPQTVLA